MTLNFDALYKIIIILYKKLIIAKYIYCSLLYFNCVVFFSVFLGKSLPIHCIVEQSTCDDRGTSQHNIEVDSYAIIPGNTLFCEILRTALLKLGYTATDCIGAKGKLINILSSVQANIIIPSPSKSV